MNAGTRAEKTRCRVAAVNLSVSDLMSSPVHVVRPSDTLADAADLMERYVIRHLPVVTGEGKLVGLVTHRDVLRCWTDGSPSSAVRVADVMRDEAHGEVTCTGPRLQLRTAAIRMRERQIGCLPVVDESGRLVGILTESDFVRFFADGV